MNTTPCAKEIGRLWFENVWNQRNRELVHELMAPDATGHLEGGQEVIGPEAFLEFQKAFLDAIPDMHIEVVDTLADEDDVCVHWTATGTHTGPGMGMAPSGAAVSFRGVTWFETRNGQIISGRDFWNMDGLLKSMAGAPETRLA